MQQAIKKTMGNNSSRKEVNLNYLISYDPSKLNDINIGYLNCMKIAHANFMKVQEDFFTDFKEIIDSNNNGINVRPSIDDIIDTNAKVRTECMKDYEACLHEMMATRRL